MTSLSGMGLSSPLKRTREVNLANQEEGCDENGQMVDCRNGDQKEKEQNQTEESFEEETGSQEKSADEEGRAKIQK